MLPKSTGSRGAASAVVLLRGSVPGSELGADSEARLYLMPSLKARKNPT